MKNITPHNPLEGHERPEMSLKLRSTCDDKISIIIIHNDRPQFLNLCLQSISIASLNNDYEIIVVDNGSGPRTQAFLDQFENDGIKVIRNNENLYWTKAVNQGIRAADKNSQYYVVMHHDITVINPAWLDILVTIAQSNSCGIVGFDIRYYAFENQKSGFIDESCMLITRDCYKECGPFVEELPQEGSSFLFSLTAAKKGFNPQATKNNCVHHWKTFALDLSDWERIVGHARVVMPKFVVDIQKS